MSETQSPSVLDLKEARRVREAATQGEWEYKLFARDGVVTEECIRVRVKTDVPKAYSYRHILEGDERDLRFIAYAANNWTALLSRLERAEEENMRVALEKMAARGIVLVDLPALRRALEDYLPAGEHDEVPEIFALLRDRSQP